MSDQPVPTPAPEPETPAEAPEEQKGGRPAEAITAEEAAELFDEGQPQGSARPAPGARDPDVATLEKERTFGPGEASEPPAEPEAGSTG